MDSFRRIELAERQDASSSGTASSASRRASVERVAFREQELCTEQLFLRYMHRVGVCIVIVLLSILLVQALRGEEGRGTHSEAQPLYASFEPGWDRIYAVSGGELRFMKEEILETFADTYGHYMRQAFPMDDLRPISCRGSNSEGGVALTLLDTLDTLIVMNQTREIQEAVQLIEQHVHFDVDFLASVFELNIRALGGLLSAHVLLKRNPNIIESYNDTLLTAALDLGRRLLPAFDPISSLPTSRINLKTGMVSDAWREVPHDVDETCVACAGTLLLEMGMLSRLTGQSIFEEKARAATEKLLSLRSNLGLLGSIVNIKNAMWKVQVSTIGANGDSFYEYLLKAYLLFGDEEALDVFIELYTAIMHHMQTPMLTGGLSWLADVDSEEGYIVGAWVSSLSAFWPGMQAIVGQLKDAQGLYSNYTSVWKRFGGLPEAFSIDGTHRHPDQGGYPLRPELIESTFLLYAATHDPHYLELGRMFQRSLLATDTFRCGYANVRDVMTRELEDGMASFFLSESLKYLFLLNSNSTALVDAFVFSTEAHLFPPLPSESNKDVYVPRIIPAECRSLCTERSPEREERDLAEIAEKYPLLRVTVEDFRLLLARRCIACVKIFLGKETRPRSILDAASHTRFIEWAIPETSHFKQRKTDVEKASAERRARYSARGTVACFLEMRPLGRKPIFSEIVPLYSDDLIAESYGAERGEIYATLFRKQKAQQLGQLVISSESLTLELQGQMRHASHLRRDTSLSQSCAAKILSALTMEEAPMVARQLELCKTFVVHGEVVLLSPKAECSRLLKRRELEGKIAILHDNCWAPDSIRSMIKAGIRGIILIQHKTTGLASVDADLKVPILIVSENAAQLVLAIMETEQSVSVMMGMTISQRLTTCPLPPPVFRPPYPSDAQSSVAFVEILVPSVTRSDLAPYVEEEGAQPLLERLVASLYKDDAVMEALFRMDSPDPQFDFW